MRFVQVEISEEEMKDRDLHFKYFNSLYRRSLMFSEGGMFLAAFDYQIFNFVMDTFGKGTGTIWERNGNVSSLEKSYTHMDPEDDGVWVRERDFCFISNATFIVKVAV